MKVELRTPITLFYSDDVPEYVFEWVQGSHGVNVFYKNQYMNEGQRDTVEYFSFDFDVDKVSMKRVQEIIEDHIKEVMLQ
jgi:hypothetical protein